MEIPPPSHSPLFDAQREVVVVFLRRTLASRPQNHAVLRVRLDAQIEIDAVADHLAHGVRVIVVEIAIAAGEASSEILAYALNLRLVLGGQVELLQKTPVGVGLRCAGGMLFQLDFLTALHNWRQKLIIVVVIAVLRGVFVGGTNFLTALRWKLDLCLLVTGVRI